MPTESFRRAQQNLMENAPKKPFPPKDGQDGKSNTVKRPERPDGAKKPIQRHIISQEIYETKGTNKRRSDNKRKDKEFNKKRRAGKNFIRKSCCPET